MHGHNRDERAMPYVKVRRSNIVLIVVDMYTSLTSGKLNYVYVLIMLNASDATLLTCLFLIMLNDPRPLH